MFRGLPLRIWCTQPSRASCDARSRMAGSLPQRTLCRSQSCGNFISTHFLLLAQKKFNLEVSVPSCLIGIASIFACPESHRQLDRVGSEPMLLVRRQLPVDQVKESLALWPGPLELPSSLSPPEEGVVHCERFLDVPSWLISRRRRRHCHQCCYNPPAWLHCAHSPLSSSKLLLNIP